MFSNSFSIVSASSGLLFIFRFHIFRLKICRNFYGFRVECVSAAQNVFSLRSNSKHFISHLSCPLWFESIVLENYFLVSPNCFCFFFGRRTRHQFHFSKFLEKADKKSI